MRRVMVQSVFLLAFCAMMSGCVLALGAAGGAGGVVYYKGNLKEYLSYPVTDIYEATIAVMDDEGMKIYKDEHDPYKAQLKFEDIDESSVWVDIEAVTREASEIKIRVGVSGDKQRATQLLEKIRTNLTL
jgi:hypothetical protein